MSTGSAISLTPSDVEEPDFVHNTVFVIVDGAGRLRTEFHGLATPAGEIAKAAIALMQPGPGPT